MIEAPILENELDRLNDLYALDLLDTFREERFDRLVQLAKKSIGVRMGYLALIDENRQWLKSKCGMSVDETGREISFCGHTIAQHKLMVVPDALKDDRFRDNPLVVNDPHVRFYAGFPLHGPDGHNVGTFCVADTEPRELSREEENMIVEFAGLAQRELNLLDVIASQNELLETQLELEKIRKNMQTELQEAADFVHQKLPPRFEDERLKLDWEFTASSQLGGDMFGMEKLGENQYLIYLLDVAGHGIGASLLAVSAQNTMRQLLTDMQGVISPSAVLQHLNANFQMAANQNKFFTMWCGVVDLDSSTIYFANGGHPAPVLFDADLNARPLGQNSMMIGISPNSRYEDEEFTYTWGSRLVLFSDGIIEELNEQDEQFGRKRLEEAYRNRCSTSACDLKAITRQVRTWNGDKPFSDDVSIVELTFK